MKRKTNRSHKIAGPPIKPKIYNLKVFNLQDPLDNIPLSRNEIQSILLPNTETLTLQFLQKKTKVLTLLSDNLNIGTIIKQNQ